MPEAAVAGHFEGLEQQAQAARLAIWAFLASEVLLFAGLFALYAAYRALHPAGFAEGVAADLRWVGSANTAILLVSSWLAATANAALRGGRGGRAAWLLVGACLLGLCFLGLKAYEYSVHIHDGALIGGHGRFYVEHPDPGLPPFFTLYWLMTGAHALHVTVGIGVLAWLAARAVRGTVSSRYSHPLELGTLYWHLVDAIWIFLWPLFYLVRA